ncbi:MAG: beta-lactamase family protein [candidate division Zixibacteria bacterium]|nr:beta-lactamase family protein [candidate division Zixibacteria bacterium]
MNKTLNLNSTLTAGLDELECSGILCALNDCGNISTHSVGSIPPEEHDKQFYIYSITKTFTATAILLLCEQSDNFLDKEFVFFFPDMSIPSDITVRQLLNHSSGLSEYGSTEYQEAVYSHPEKPWSYMKLMKYGLKNTPLFGAGKGWSYSNPGYGLLKELVELLSNKEYYSFIEEYILKPTGLHDTRPFLKPDYDCNLLQGSDPLIPDDFRTKYNPGWIATGCLISTVSDITRFYQALFSGKLISDESLKQMKETIDVPAPAPPPMIPAYGLGLMHGRNEPLGEAYGHGGGGPGYTTYAKHYPNLLGTPFTLSLVLNKTLPSTPFGLADDIINKYIKFKKSEQVH